VAWLAADGAIGMTAGLTANSVALIGWGLDCAIEAVASFAIIWRFTGVRIQSANAERLAQKIVLFHMLLGYLITRTLLVLVRVFTRLQAPPGPGARIRVAAGNALPHHMGPVLRQLPGPGRPVRPGISAEAPRQGVLQSRGRGPSGPTPQGYRNGIVAHVAGIWAAAGPD